MASLVPRGKYWSIQYRVNGKLQRISTGTTSLQLAKEKLRQFQSASLRGGPSPLPTRTPIADVVTHYVEHLRAKKTAKSAQTDLYYLREIFGPIRDARSSAARSARSPGSAGRARARTGGAGRR